MPVRWPSGLPRASLPLLQDEELLGHVQSAILQVQGDCEKLNITTSNLIEDHRQKQKDIDVSSPRAPGVEMGLTQPGHPCHSALPTPHFLCSVGPQVLYQGIERLEKEKADRDRLELEIDVVSTRPQESPLAPSPGQGQGRGGGMEPMGRDTPTPTLVLSCRKQTRALWHPK